MTSGMGLEGLAIDHAGHRTRLKWHQLRRSLGDPLFSADVLADGLRLGASLELDLRVRNDGGFVVLHDAELEGETTGMGIVADMPREDIARARYLDGRALLFSEELAGLLTKAHPDALLQFDMKDRLPAIGERGMAHLAALFAAPACPVIIGAEDLDIIVATRERLPQLRRGIDPTDKQVAIAKREGWGAIAPDLVSDLTGPTAPDTVYLAWQLVLAAAREGADLIAICHDHGVLVDAWTFNLADSAEGFSDSEWRDFAALMALRPDQITTDEAPAMEAAWRARAAKG